MGEFPVVILEVTHSMLGTEEYVTIKIIALSR